MKKILSILAAMVFILSLSACSTESATTEELGKITAIDGKNITISTYIQQAESEDDSDVMPSGEAEEVKSVADQNAASEKPEGEASDSQQETPPEMPEGEASGNEPNSEQGAVPEKPDGETSDNQQETPPEKPDGETSDNEPNAEQGAVPEKPEGEATDSQQETSPEMPGESSENLWGEEKTITITKTSVLYKYDNGSETQAELSDITVGSILKITYNGEKIEKIIIGTEDDFDIKSAVTGGAQGGMSAPGGSSSDVVYDGATELTASAAEDSKTYETEQSDQSALLIDTSEDVTINNPTVTKTGDSDGGDNCNFYGQNAALLVKGGSTTTITGGTVYTSASGANGVFSYGGNGGQNGAEGDGTTVIISDTEITTTGDGSGGIMTTGGGITKASNLTVTTNGQSSAAIRTDRGGGTVEVDGGTYTTNGLGSPSIYSTADITVSNAKLISNLSEGVCIEGLNSIELNNTDLTANNTKCNGQATFYDTIMIYQSMSGDAASGTSSFTMNGGTLTSKNGHVFHVTNTNAIITLNGVAIVNEDGDNILLSVCDDGWSGSSNVATLNAVKQTLTGGILVGDNSTLTLNLTDGSSFTGYINGKITNASGETVSTEVGNVSVTLDDNSTWTLTGDSYVTSFSGSASNVISNGYTLYVNGVALTGTK